MLVINTNKCSLLTFVGKGCWHTKCELHHTKSWYWNEWNTHVVSSGMGSNCVKNCKLMKL